MDPTERRETPHPDEAISSPGPLDDPSPAGVAPGQHAHFRFQPTLADYVRENSRMIRRSPGALGIATFIIGSGLVTMWEGDLTDALWVLVGLSLVSGLIVVPFVWLTARRRPDLLFAEVEVSADSAGLTLATTASTSTMAWSVFRRVRETGDVFLLDPTTGRMPFVLKRGADPGEIEAFRSLLRANGLRPSRSNRLLPAFAAVAGLAVVAAGSGHAVLETLGANATISMSATVHGRTVDVHATTDLPDQSSVVVELVQLDEYDRARASGAGLDPADSPWIVTNYVTVEAGSFTTSFDVPTWPSGRINAIAFFWMWSGQPPSAAERYGSDGGSMAGPNVVETTDRGRMLEVETTFQMP